jgi:hypothetical protein
MCRVLVRWTEKPRQLACLEDWKYEATRSRRGDPIVVKPDGHVWGREEGLPNYVSLDLDGVPKELVKQFIVPDNSVFLRPDNGKPFRLHKRAWNINLDALPTVVVDRLRADGHATITAIMLSGKIVHKRTGETR